MGRKKLYRLDRPFIKRGNNGLGVIDMIKEVEVVVETPRTITIREYGGIVQKWKKQHIKGTYFNTYKEALERLEKEVDISLEQEKTERLAIIKHEKSLKLLKQDIEGFKYMIFLDEQEQKKLEELNNGN